MTDKKPTELASINNRPPLKQGSKVMDVSHPQHITPSMSSRPIIVANRPMIDADPMIAQAAEAAATYHDPSMDVPEPTQSVVPMTTQTDQPPTAPVINKHQSKIITSESTDEIKQLVIVAGSVKSTDGADDDKDKSEKTLQSKSINQIDASKNDVSVEKHTPDLHSKSVDNDESSAISEANIIPNVESKTEHEHNEAIESTKLEDEPRAEADMSGSTEAPSASAAQTQANSMEPRPLGIDQDQEASETENNHDSNVEAMIASGQYFLPIDQVKHRHQRELLAFLAIILLSILVLDVLLDVGIINLDGLPHTSFFAL